jgi:hypothetical protein
VGRAKDIIVKPISAKDGNRIVRALHYSGKVVNNSQVHLGVFLDGKCGGAMQFGPSLDKRKIQGLVRGTLWNEFIELNRMAFADWLPRNGESRAIGFAMRWLRKTYPHLQWVVSFADGCQCGDGTIYRASGFVLAGIKANSTIVERPDGTTGSELVGGRHTGGKAVPGFQLRYIYFLDPTARELLTVPILPFSEIDRRGAGMYRGKPRVRSVDSDTPANHAGEGGASPTRTLLDSVERCNG